MRGSFFNAFGSSRFGRRLAVGSQLVVGKHSETKNLLTQFGTLGLLTFSAKKGIEFCNPEPMDDKKAKTGLAPGNGG